MPRVYVKAICLRLYFVPQIVMPLRLWRMESEEVISEISNLKFR
jgi:hypothetical protein